MRTAERHDFWTAAQRLRILLFLLVILLAPGRGANAAPVTAQQAENAVKAWLAQTPRPLGTQIGTAVAGVQTFKDAHGSVRYYIVNLSPGGYAIVGSDDLIEPILGFFASGRYNPAPDNPLRALLEHDTAERTAEARAQAAAAKGSAKPAAPTGRMVAAQQKWGRLLQPKAALQASVNVSQINDLRVAPLVQSRWDQGGVGGAACYNYYTPPNAAGSYQNYPCGCVATALAQLMRYYQCPTSGVGVKSFSVKVDGASQSRSLRGGDGSGGAYDWANMPLAPASGMADTQRRAIGALTGDAAAAISTDFATTGSAADLLTSRDRMLDTFKYANAAEVESISSLSTATVAIAANTNIDAGFPVIVGIVNAATRSGHAVVCDGYGYNATTLYHHLNLGWSGYSDGWYNLPNIGTSSNFDTVVALLFNVYPTGQGEIISGRILDSQGLPVNGATVTATRAGGSSVTAQTNANGIYALKYLPAKTTFNISVQAQGYSFTSAKSASTGIDGSLMSNAWGVNFQSQQESLPHVNFVQAASSVTESAGTASIDVALDIAPAQPVQAGYAVTGGTASAGSDYILTSGTLQLAAGQTQASITVPIIDDALSEPNKTVVITLAAKSGCILGRSATHTLTILDDDTSLADAVDNTQLTWQTEGDAVWFPESTFSYDGFDAAQSGEIAPGETSTLYTYVTGPGTLSFWWGAMTQTGDLLYFYDNGGGSAIAGSGQLEEKTVQVGEGTHLLRWVFKRSASSPQGPSHGWLDQVAWTGGVPKISAPTPCSGTPAPIPGVIEAESYDLGGNASAYFDTTPGNDGGAYRLAEDVDITTCTDGGSGYSVTSIAPGEWLGYTVRVTQSGPYTIRLRVAAPYSGTTCRLELNGIDLTGDLALPSTGGAQTYQTLEVKGVNLMAGTGILRLRTETGYFNINWIQFLSENAGSLQVTLGPAEAVSAGAAWRRVGTSAWHASGETETLVPVGECTIEFKDLAGWSTPLQQSTTVMLNTLATASAAYVRLNGALQVNLAPNTVVSAGAKWRRVGTTAWQDSGGSEANLPAGKYTLEFSTIPNWIAPANTLVTVNANQTTQAGVTYQPRTSAVNREAWEKYD